MKLQFFTEKIILQIVFLPVLWIATFSTIEVGSLLTETRESHNQDINGPKNSINQLSLSQTKIFLPVISFRGTTPYYISLNGADPADCSGGTQSKPWKTWSKAERCVKPGSTVYFTAGTYPNIFAESSRTKITFKGTSGQPIQIKPAPGAEQQVYFKQPLTLYGTYGVLSGIDIAANGSAPVIAVYDAHHIILEGNKVHQTPSHDCIHIHRYADNISVIGNEIFDCGYDTSSGQGDGIDTTGGQNLIFRGNYVHNAYTGFQIKGGANNILVENNRIRDVGVAIWGSSMGSLTGQTPQLGNPQMHDPAVSIEARYQARNLTIRNNLIYNTTGFSALSANGWVDYNIYNNTFLNLAGSYAFHLGYATWEFFDSTAIAYCTTHSCKPCTEYSGSLTCVKITLLARNGEIKNNIVYGFRRLLLAEASNFNALEMSHNLYYAQNFTASTTAYVMEGKGYTLSQFKALGHELNSSVANPQFVNPNDALNPNLNLISTSPAVNRGLPLTPQDIEGTARPQGPAHDIGAYEFYTNTN